MILSAVCRWGVPLVRRGGLALSAVCRWGVPPVRRGGLALMSAYGTMYTWLLGRVMAWLLGTWLPEPIYVTGLWPRLLAG